MNEIDLSLAEWEGCGPMGTEEGQVYRLEGRRVRPVLTASLGFRGTQSLSIFPLSHRHVTRTPLSQSGEHLCAQMQDCHLCTHPQRYAHFTTRRPLCMHAHTTVTQRYARTHVHTTLCTQTHAHMHRDLHTCLHIPPCTHTRAHTHVHTTLCTHTHVHIDRKVPTHAQRAGGRTRTSGPSPFSSPGLIAHILEVPTWLPSQIIVFFLICIYLFALF